MDLSCIVAKRKIIVGGEKRVLPNAARNRIFISSGYSFRIMEELIMKHNPPSPKRRAEFQIKEIPFVLRFADVPVTKTIRAKAMTKMENSRNGILRINRK